MRVRFVVYSFTEQEKIMAELTPMMQKYMETKEQYKDCILFYRLGFCICGEAANGEKRISGLHPLL